MRCTRIGLRQAGAVCIGQRPGVPMVVLTPERMAKDDGYAINTWGIPSTVLMENAGRNTYRRQKNAISRAGNMWRFSVVGEITVAMVL